MFARHCPDPSDSMSAVDDGARREGSICEQIKMLKSAYLALSARHQRNSLVKSFLAGIKRQARVDWWPSLRAMHTTRSRISDFGPAHVIKHEAAVREWTRFGETLGLDAGEEQKRHERAASRRCSWFVCQWHRTTPDQDVRILSCKGCGEVRYCGRTCQTR